MGINPDRIVCFMHVSSPSLTKWSSFRLSSRTGRGLYRWTRPHHWTWAAPNVATRKVELTSTGRVATDVRTGIDNFRKPYGNNENIRQLLEGDLKNLRLISRYIAAQQVFNHKIDFPIFSTMMRCQHLAGMLFLGAWRNVPNGNFDLTKIFISHWCTEWFPLRKVHIGKSKHDTVSLQVNLPIDLSLRHLPEIRHIRSLQCHPSVSPVVWLYWSLYLFIDITVVGLSSGSYT